MVKRVAKLTKAGLPKQSGAKPGDWGVKHHVPTDEMREAVMKYVAVGCTGRQLEVLLNLSQQTLARDYAHEVEHGRMVKIAKLGVSAYERALAGDPAMTRLVLTTQGAKFGWRPKETLDFEAEIAPASTGGGITVKFVRASDTDEE